MQLCLVYFFAAAWKWDPVWRSEGTGVYLALLTNSQNYQNYITFVVRDDGR